MGFDMRLISQIDTSDPNGSRGPSKRNMWPAGQASMAGMVGLAGLAVVFFDPTAVVCAPLRKLSKATRPSAVDAYSLVRWRGSVALEHLTGHSLRMTLHGARPQLEARNFITVKQANTNQIPNTPTHARHRLVLCRFSK